MLGDLHIVDDLGRRYEWKNSGSHYRRLDDGTIHVFVDLFIEPVPARSVQWFELRNNTGSTVCLEPASRPLIHVKLIAAGPMPVIEREIVERLHALIMSKLMRKRGGSYVDDLCKELESLVAERTQSGELPKGGQLENDVTLLCTALTQQPQNIVLPPTLARFLDAAALSDGAPLNYSFELQLPTIDGVTLLLDTLISGSEGWRIYLLADPGWSFQEVEGRGMHTSIIHASDNRGGRYLAHTSPRFRDECHDEIVVRFQPRLDPLAEALQLVVSGEREEVLVDIVLQDAISN
jgi:hypothetical protein